MVQLCTQEVWALGWGYRALVTVRAGRSVASESCVASSLSESTVFVLPTHVHVAGLSLGRTVCVEVQARLGQRWLPSMHSL